MQRETGANPHIFGLLIARLDRCLGAGVLVVRAYIFQLGVDRLMARSRSPQAAEKRHRKLCRKYLLHCIPACGKGALRDFCIDDSHLTDHSSRTGFQRAGSKFLLGGAPINIRLPEVWRPFFMPEWGIMGKILIA